MEIKCVKNECEKKYPKINEFSNKKLKSYIPNNWTKIGITSLIFEIIIKNKVIATAINPAEIQVLGGDVAVIEEIPTIASKVNMGITIGTVVLFIISFLGLCLTKIKFNKDKSNQRLKKVNIVFRILLFLSIVVFVIWKIIYMFNS